MMNYIVASKSILILGLAPYSSCIMLLLLYSLKFDVPRRFTPLSNMEAYVKLNLLPPAFIFNRKILSLTADRKRLPVLSRIRAGARFSDVYTDIGERSLFFVARTYLFGIRDVERGKHS